MNNNVTVINDQPGSLLAAIMDAARDPAVDVEKLERLLQMQERLEAKAAERAYCEALASVQANIPRVKKNGTIELRKDGKVHGKVPFATWEDMDAVLRPHLIEYGLTLSFSSRQSQNGFVIVGIVWHLRGHREEYEGPPLPSDTGPGRNALQAIGSTLSYSQRYIAGMIFNIVREGEDDDGARAGLKLITHDQAMQIEVLIADSGADRAKFMSHFGVNSLLDIRQDKYIIAVNMLRQKQASRNA